MDDTKEELARQIRECLTDFPFEKVAECYQLMGHEWSRLGRPPTAVELRECAETLFERILSGEADLARTGGLFVERDPDGLGGVSLLYACARTVK